MNTELAGRIHPMLVHFPIGFLVLAFLLELLSNLKKFRKVRGAVPLTVFLGTAAAVISVLSGLVLSEEGGYEPDLIFRHRLFGIMTAAVAVMLWLIITYEKNLAKSRRRPVRLAVFTVLICILTITGNFGGTITHGRGFLSSQADVKQSPNPEKVQNPALVYRDIVRPILNQKCVACHGPNKQKGKLRLDSEAFITKGGKSGFVFHTIGNKSELIRRIHLTSDDEDHMPPKEKEQLSILETEILTEWIDERDPFRVTVLETESPSVRRYLDSFKDSEMKSSYWPDEPIDPASETDLQKLTSYGVRCRPLSRESNYLDIKVPPDLKPDGPFWNTYKKIMPNIFSLDLSGSKLTGTELKLYTEAIGIRKLFLNQTNLGSISLAPLRNLKSLYYLNLVDAELNDEKLIELSGHSSLRKVYVFGNKLSKTRVAEFIRINQSIRLDTGNQDLPFRSSDTVIFKP